MVTRRLAFQGYVFKKSLRIEIKRKECIQNAYYICRLTKNSTYSAFIRIFGNEYFFPWLCDEMSYFYKISYFYLTFRKFAISLIQIHFLRPQKGNSSPWILKKWSLPHKKIYYRLPCNLPYYDRVGWFFFP